MEVAVCAGVDCSERKRWGEWEEPTGSWRPAGDVGSSVWRGEVSGRRGDCPEFALT